MLAVEQLMQRYYRIVMDLSRLNELLLQRFQEEILMNPDVTPTDLTERFQAKNGFLQISDSDVFENEPSALLELFLLLQQHSGLKGVSATTITAIKRSLHLYFQSLYLAECERRDKLEAENARYREALDEVASDPCCETEGCSIEYPCCIPMSARAALEPAE